MPTIYTTILPQILCFSPRDGQNNYVKIYKGSGCSSQVGMNGGEQGISLVGTVGTAGCWHQHPIVHEFIHAFGFYHEHMRPDRDDYVEIIWENIPEGLWYLFDKIAGSTFKLKPVRFLHRISKGSKVPQLYGTYGKLVSTSVVKHGKALVT